MYGCVLSVILSLLTITLFYSIGTKTAGATPYDAYTVHASGADAFSWSICNTTEVPIVVTRLFIQPDPIRYGKSISVSSEVNVAEDIPNKYPIEVDLKVMLKMGPEYYDICIFNESLCHVTDLCKLLAEKTIFKCPNSFKKNLYPIPLLQETVKNLNPAPTGRFNVTANISSNKRQLACLNVQFCMSQCDD